MNIRERSVQAIWFDDAFRPSCLHTNRGNLVRVIFPGEWNTGIGPDFVGATIELVDSGKVITGDVEVHIRPGDWIAHGHGADRAYDNVRIHVTWHAGAPPESLPREAVSIALEDAFSADGRHRLEDVDCTAYPERRGGSAVCGCFRVDNEMTSCGGSMLADAGEQRLRGKALKYCTSLSTRKVGGMQFFYEEVMNALGYSASSKSFRTLAEMVPYDVLMESADNALNAVLVAASALEWSHARLRPNNYPERRLKSAVGLFQETPVMELTHANDFCESGCREMLKILTFRGYVGKGRAAAILANVVLPFALAQGRVKKFPEWLPAEDISKPVRIMASRLFGLDHNPLRLYANNGLYIQGLIHIYRSYCSPSYPVCDVCKMKTAAANERELYT